MHIASARRFTFLFNVANKHFGLHKTKNHQHQHCSKAMLRKIQSRRTISSYAIDESDDQLMLISRGGRTTSIT